VLIGTAHLDAQSFLDQGRKLMDASDYPAAQRYFQTQLDDCRANCADSVQAYYRIYLGKTLHLQDKYDSALIHYKLGIALFQSSKCPNGEVFGLASLAEFYRSLFDFEKAEEVLKAGESILENHPISSRNKAYFFNRYAAVLNEAGSDKTLAIQYTHQVIDMAEAMGDMDLKASSLNELGFIYEIQKNPEALKYYAQARDLYEKIGNVRYEASVYSNLSRASFEFGRINASMAYAKRGLKLCKGRGWLKAEPELYYLLYRNYRKLNWADSAYAAFDQYHNAFMRARESEWNEAMLEIGARFDLSEKEKQLAETKYAQEVAILGREQKSRQLNYTLVLAFFALAFSGGMVWGYFRVKKTNELLSRNIEEKEVLRREVHHRVKNNLTFLQSLLYLQSKATQVSDVKTILDEAHSRIHTMSLVHQHLYDEDVSTEIDLKTFFDELYTQLRDMFHRNDEETEIDIDVQDIKIDMNRSVFLGLIVNELITNSFKYAFQPAKKGKISIVVAEKQGKIELIYSDNGPGLPADFDLEASGGFGHRLIRMLVSQINAKMTYDATNGSTFRFLIPR